MNVQKSDQLPPEQTPRKLVPDDASQPSRQWDPSSAARRFFINLAVWIGIVLVVLFVLNVVVPRFR